MFSQSSLELIALVAMTFGLLSGAMMAIGGLVLILYDILDPFLP